MKPIEGNEEEEDQSSEDRDELIYGISEEQRI